MPQSAHTYTGSKPGTPRSVGLVEGSGRLSSTSILNAVDAEAPEKTCIKGWLKPECLCLQQPRISLKHDILVILELLEPYYSSWQVTNQSRNKQTTREADFGDC